MKREDALWIATGAVLAFAIAVFGFGRGMALAWPWFIVGALVGLLASLTLRKIRG